MLVTDHIHISRIILIFHVNILHPNQLNYHHVTIKLNKHVSGLNIWLMNEATFLMITCSTAACVC